MKTKEKSSATSSRGAAGGSSHGAADLSIQKKIATVAGAFNVPSPLLYLFPAMADASNRYSQNIPGAFYVDDQCIDCDLCRETAPANFKRDDDGGHSFVFKQPESPEEEALCKEAMEGCPVEAIGSDGQ